MSEIVAMVVSFLVALVMTFVVKDSMADHMKLITGVAVTTLAWVTTAMMTRPTDEKVLSSFFRLIRPHAYGWKPVVEKGMASGEITAAHLRSGSLAAEIMMMFLGCICIYALLFGMGYVLYGRMMAGLVSMAVALAAAWGIRWFWKSKA